MNKIKNKVEGNLILKMKFQKQNLEKIKEMNLLKRELRNINNLSTLPVLGNN